jgi:hypothetical protein
MLSRPCELVCQPTTGEVPRRIFQILSDLLSRVDQVLDNAEAETEPEQSIEKSWLAEEQKSEAEQLIENKGSRFGQIFY